MNGKGFEAYSRLDGVDGTRRICRHFASTTFIAAPYIGTLCPGLLGCAYINNNCRANNKAGESTLDSPKLLVPLLWPATFYCLHSAEREKGRKKQTRMAGSTLRPSRWRINDPAIRCSSDGHISTGSVLTDSSANFYESRISENKDLLSFLFTRARMSKINFLIN